MKILKIIAICILGLIACIIVIFIALLFIISKLPAVPTNYCNKIETGANIEAKYIKLGSYKTSETYIPTQESWGEMVIHYPTNLAEQKRLFPVVIFVNGTGIPASKYPALFKHLASWGFIVLGNEDPSTCTGASTDYTLAYILKENKNPESIFFNKIDTLNIGISGHSQGGVGVFNAITKRDLHSCYKCAVALSPTNESAAKLIPDFEYDLSQVTIPTLLVAGDKGDFETKAVIPLDEMTKMYDRLKADKVMLRRKDCEHGQSLYMADGYATAWFMWHLQNDPIAEEVFAAKDAELYDNELYQDVRIDLQKNISQ